MFKNKQTNIAGERWTALNRYKSYCRSKDRQTDRQVDEVIERRKEGRIYRINPKFAKFKMASRFRVSSID